MTEEEGQRRVEGAHPSSNTPPPPEQQLQNRKIANPAEHAAHDQPQATPWWNIWKRDDAPRPIDKLLRQASDQDVITFAADHFPEDDSFLEGLRRAVRISKNLPTYLSSQPRANGLEPNELHEVHAETKDAYSQKGMLFIILTVGLAAFLQGHVQASINAASLYATWLGIPPHRPEGDARSDVAYRASDHDWMLGGMNASPYIAAAFIGAPLSLPLNYWFGRRGAIALAASLVLVSSLASAFMLDWRMLLAIRVVNGVGMGIKAVSAPILASETAVAYWRGSAILMWQLWVAGGIMVGNGINLVLVQAAGAMNVATNNNTTDLTPDDAKKAKLALQLILGAPFVPALLTLGTLLFCAESPRRYMMRNNPRYSPRKAFDILKKIRNTEFQALRDTFLIHRSIEDESGRLPGGENNAAGFVAPTDFAGWVSLAFRDMSGQYFHLFETPRLRNAVLSTCIVALTQQLCGINVFAFYSNVFFARNLDNSNIIGNGGNPGDPNSNTRDILLYSFGFGLVNLSCGLVAIRSIDAFGRRAWLLTTLPIMSLLLAAAALFFLIPDSDLQVALVAVFVFLFVAAYSPGLGPIPFTLAAESFPSLYRESGCSVAVSINLLFAGLLSILFPWINTGLNHGGTLGLFSGLNLVAFILVFLLVEETKTVDLDSLGQNFEQPKFEFIRFQSTWILYLLSGGRRERPDYNQWLLRDDPQLGDEMTDMSQGSVDRDENENGQ